MERINGMWLERWKKVLALCLIVAAAGWGETRAGEMKNEEQLSPPPPGAADAAMREKRPEMEAERFEAILNQIRQTDPKRADELMQLRDKDPEAFQMELRRIMREHFEARMREQTPQQQGQQPRRPGDKQMADTPGAGTQNRMGHGGPEMMRDWMKEKSDEYIKWLENNYPDEAAKLKRLKEEDPDQYMRAVMISGKKYGPIFFASKDNPQLATVLKEQMTLKEKRSALLKQIKATTDEKQKKELLNELEKVVGQQFDLIVKRKQLAYEDLTRKLEQLQKEVDQRKAEVEKWKSKDFKNEQVKQRVNELVNETEKFEWEN
jgi:hypothetical protein